MNHRFVSGAQEAIELLIQARECAIDAGASLLDFAVEIEHLSKTGLNASLLRWLMNKELIEHWRDITRDDQPSRELRPGNMKFSESSCFILTERGYHLLLGGQANDIAAKGCDLQGPFVARNETVPHWNPDRHELTLGGLLVKRFRLPSANQEKVLEVFEEEEWPPRIDDPLAPFGNANPKRRLHDCIRNLNRNQRNPLLRFRGDGTGEGVLWERIDSSRTDAPRSEAG